MEAGPADTADSDTQEYVAGVRLIVLNLPEDEGEGLGFRLTRTLWDPYPWVREVTAGSRADTAGLKTGDCLLQADGKDLLGLPIGQVAGLIRGDGSGHGVSLLCWNCGVDPNDDPELLWSCGGGPRGERARRALAGVLRALACCVCAATATKAFTCARSHLYCESCWSRLDRCALCRENLPPKDSPFARNLVAEQVFEAIATEYEIKDAAKHRTRATSAYNSPARSPSASPAASRRGLRQLSAMNKRRLAHYSDKCASDPNIHRSSRNNEFVQNASSKGRLGARLANSCKCQISSFNTNGSVPTINVEPAACEGGGGAGRGAARSLAELPRAARPRCGCGCYVQPPDGGSGSDDHNNSMDDIKCEMGGSCDPHLFVLSPPPIYLLTCDHNK